MRFSSLLTLFILLSIQALQSQEVNSKLTVEGVRITIDSNNTLYVNGNVHVKENNKYGYNIHNEGKLIITDTLFNDVDSLFVSSSIKKLSQGSKEKEAFGSISFEGKGVKHITGNPLMYFSNIYIEDTLLTLDTSIKVFGEIKLNHSNNSNLYLNGNTIQLYDMDPDVKINTGVIDSSMENNRAETSTSRIYDDSTGMIKSFKNNTSMPANLGFRIDYNSYGWIYLTRYHLKEKNVTNGSMKESFIIEESDLKDYETYLGESSNMEIHYLDTNLTSRMLADTTELGIFQNSFSSNSNSTYYKHIGGNHYRSEKKIETNVDFKAGSYTIAETHCDNPPAINIPNDTTVCINEVNDTFLFFPVIKSNKKIVEYNWQYIWNNALIRKNNKSFKFPQDSLKLQMNDTLTVWLNVTSSIGCVSKDTMNIIVRPEPELFIDYSTALGTSKPCVHDMITFYDTTKNKGTMHWDIAEDIEISSIQDTTIDTLRIAFDHSFAHNSGERTIKKITKTSQYGCKTDTAVSLKVFPVPNVNFYSDNPNCAGTPLTLINETTLDNSAIENAPVNTFTWSIDDNDTITVTDSNHFADGNVKWYKTDTIKDSNRNPDLQYLPSNTGDLNINLHAKTITGCISDTTIKITVHDSVDASIKTLSTEPYCFGDTIRFTAGPNASESTKVDEYEWIFPDHTISTGQKEDTVNYIATQTGELNVKLVVIGKTGCSDTSTTQITVQKVPETDFTVKEPVCYGDTSLFEVTNTKSSDNLTWDMEGAVFSTSPNEKVNYAFSKTGENRVKLTITNEHGCKTIRKDTAYVGPIPEASFETFDKCINTQNSDTIILNNSNNEGLSAHAVKTNYSWDFGDGTTSFKKQPLKNYQNPANYNITLTSITKYKYKKDSLSCESRTDENTQIFPVAQANILTEAEICQDEKINLSAQTTLPDSINHYEWNLGDTIISDYSDNLMNYRFQENGQSNISMTAITNHGCRDTATKTLSVHPKPLASFKSDSVCFNETIKLEANTGENSGNCNYEWNIHNGSRILTNSTISYTPGNTGYQNVVLSVKSDFGCESADTGHVMIHELPENNLTNNLSDTLNRCDDEVTLNAYSPGCLYSWSNSSTDKEITVQQDGEYEVTVTDSLTGCSSSSSVYVDLNSKLNIDLPTDTAVCGNITLDAGYFGENIDYIWNTGSMNRTLNVKENGQYSVEVSSSSCSASATTQVTVYENPKPDFNSTYFETCISDSIHIDAGIPEGDTYLWTNLNNGNTFSGKEQMFSSSIKGTEQYRIKITTVNNCSATEKLTMQFREKPKVELGADTSTCQNNNLLLDATSLSAVSYKWSTGETGSSISPKAHSASQETKSYAVEVENKYGCKARDSVNVTFYPVPEVSLPEQITSCKNESVTLHASSPFASEYKWNTGETDSMIYITENEISIGSSAPFYVTATSAHNCSAKSNKAYIEFIDPPTPVLPDSIVGCNQVTLNAGNYGADFNWSNGSQDQAITAYETGRYSVNIQSGNGCTISDTVHATVNHVTKPYLGSDIPICKNEEKILRTGIHDDQYSFEWNGYSTGDTMLIASAGTYWVKAMHENGCTAADTVQVTEKASPEVDLGPDTYMCNEDNIILDAGEDGLFYEWGSSEDTTAYSRTIEVSDTGRYWVSVESTDGCITRDTINIKHTNHSINADFITHSKLISGDSVKFIDMSHPEPTNWRWEFGDYTSSVLQDPVHVYYGKGRYRVVQHVSNGYCSATQAKIIKVEQAQKSADSTETAEGIPGGNYIDIANVSIFPNPNKGKFTIKGDLTTRADLNIYVFNIMGKLTSVQKLDGVKSFNRRIHIESLPDGIYIVKLLAGTSHKTYKIIKQ